MEDAMLSKMIWMHLGSHKAKHDAVTMWKRGGEFNPASPLNVLSCTYFPRF